MFIDIDNKIINTNLIVYIKLRNNIIHIFTEHDEILSFSFNEKSEEVFNKLADKFKKDFIKINEILIRKNNIKLIKIGTNLKTLKICYFTSLVFKESWINIDFKDDTGCLLAYNLLASELKVEVL